MNTRTPFFSRVLTIIFFLFGAGFLVSLGTRPYPLSWLIKTIPILCLAAIAFLNFQPVQKRLLGAGLLFSALGDILLEMTGPGLFEAGMGAFILAHICYIFLFIQKPEWNWIKGLVMGIMTLFSIGFAFMLFPHLGPMTLPIYIYLGVILIMGISACLGRDNHWLVIAGACLFISSDAMIAFSRFISPIPHSSFWIMTTYYAAQGLLTAGAGKSCAE